MLLSLALIGLFSKVHAGCENACSGHGQCNAKDACDCDYKWTGNNCNQRICQFHKAHVDSGYGDIDGDGAISDISFLAGAGSDIYYHGTTEKYTTTTNTDGDEVPGMSHGYAECSNKGSCDRITGLCECFDGFTGTGCQYMECPNGCSSHGVCNSKRKIAKTFYDNMYELWDKDSTMGCQCDAGFSGPDCSQKLCPIGVDPTYTSGSYKNAIPNNFTAEFYTVGTGSGYIAGNYSLVFEDFQGRSYETAVLDIRSTCPEIRAAIQALPNKFLPGRIACHRSTLSRGYLTINGTSFESSGTGVANINTNNGQETAIYGPNDVPVNGLNPNQEAITSGRFLFERYTLVFPDEAKPLKTPMINIFHNGKKRPSLEAKPKGEHLSYKFYRNGFKASDIDYFFQKCDGVVVRLGRDPDTTNGYYTLEGLDDSTEISNLKKCLGGSNGDPTDNTDVENWNYGDVKNPHLVVVNELSKYAPWNWKDDHFAEEYNLVKHWNFDGMNLDRTSIKEPITRICDDVSNEMKRYNDTLGGDPFCANAAPASFMLVMYYDYTGSKWAVFNNAWIDYDQLQDGLLYTYFSVYATPNWLQLVSSEGYAMTHRNVEEKAKMDFTNIITTETDLSCENNNEADITANNNMWDCLNVGDEVVLITMPKYDSGATNLADYSHKDTIHSQACNPSYLNMYEVKKVWIQSLVSTQVTDATIENANAIRNKSYVTLDTGTNAVHDAGCLTYIYKLMKNTTVYPKGGPQYRGECGMRGDCDRDTGICDCNPGFTGVSCEVVDVLAM